MCVAAQRRLSKVVHVGQRVDDGTEAEPPRTVSEADVDCRPDYSPE